MVQHVARVYNGLSPDERLRIAIFGNSWGEAAAIDFYGPRYGLPPAISKHNNYWYWGPRNYTGDIAIVLGSDGRGDREHFGVWKLPVRWTIRSHAGMNISRSGFAVG